MGAREAELAAQYGVGFAGIKEAAKLSTIMQDALGKLVTPDVDVVVTEFVSAEGIFRKNERTLQRKVTEACLAIRLNRSWSKNRILAEYMNQHVYPLLRRTHTEDVRQATRGRDRWSRS